VRRSACHGSNSSSSREQPQPMVAANAHHSAPTTEATSQLPPASGPAAVAGGQGRQASRMLPCKLQAGAGGKCQNCLQVLVYSGAVLHGAAAAAGAAAGAGPAAAAGAAAAPAATQTAAALTAGMTRRGRRRRRTAWRRGSSRAEAAAVNRPVDTSSSGRQVGRLARKGVCRFLLA
jgi:hypothetical protein